jgi:anti-sigma factor RsiW
VLFADILSDTPSPGGVRRSLELFHGIAQSYLHIRGAERSLHVRIGTSFDDLAYDAICYFFFRGYDGTFPHLLHNLPHGDLRDRSDGELLAAVRRMTAEFIEGEVVRRIKESDRSFDRILRNVRNAVHTSPILRDVRRGNVHWVIVAGAEDDGSPLPVMPPDLLEEALLPHASQRSTVPSLVALVAAALRDQSIYRKMYPLDALTVVIQNVYVRAHLYALTGPGCGGERNTPDLERNVLRSVAEVETRMRRPLMMKEGIPGATYARYMKAAAEILQISLQSAPEADFSYYRILEKHLTGLKRAVYLRYHRSRLEFIVRSARQRYVDNVRNA